MTGADGHASTTEIADRQRFLRFALVGAAAAAVNIASRVAISQFLRFEVAVIFAFPIALTFAFVLTRMLVFKVSDRSVSNEYLRFLLVNLVALVQVWLVSVGLTNWLFPAIGFTWRSELVAHTLAVYSPIFTSYYAHKVFTFR